MKCPKCESLLVITDRQSIEIDYCPQCRGIWLDRGELDKLIERSKWHYERKASFYDDGHRDDHRHWNGRHSGKYDEDSARRSQKKSLLGDLFEL